MSVHTKLTYASPADPLPKQVLIRSIERLTGRRRLERIYDTVLVRNPTSSYGRQSYITCACIQVDYDANQLAKVPKTGPLILMANHPYGVLDGLDHLPFCHPAPVQFSNFDQQSALP